MKYYQQLSAASVALISLIALMGWWIDHHALANSLPAIADMTFNTALSFMLLALACGFPSKKTSTPSFLRLYTVLACAVGLFAALSLLQDQLGWNLGIDNFLFDSHGFGLSSPHPGRMSPLTSIGFMLCASILLTFKQPSLSFISHSLILLLMMLAVVGIGMSLLMMDVPDHYDHFASISMLTAISFFILAIALLSLFQAHHQHTPNLLLHSGIQLMYKLKYPQKFALISIVFIIPLCVLMMQELDQHALQISQAKLKLIGIHHIEETSKLVKAIPEHRGMTNAYLSNSSVFASTLQAKTAEIDHLFAANKSMDTLDAASIHVPDAWQGILARWQQIKSLQGDAINAWRLHSEMIALINKHIRYVGKQTLLSFDPDPHMHNLLALQLEVMPNVLEQIGQLRGQGASFIAAKQLTAQDQLMLATTISQISLLLTEAKELLRPFSELPRTLKVSSFQFFSTTNAFILTAKQQMIHHALLSLSPEEYFSLGSQAIAQGNALNVNNMQLIKQMLHQRINVSITAQYNIKLMAILVSLLLLYLFAAFYRSTMNTIHALDQVSKQMRQGEMTNLAAIPSQDEMGDIVGSFNRVAEELMRVSSNMRAVVDHAVDGIITIDAHGIIKSFNPAAEQVFGYEADQVIGQNITMLMPESLRQRHEQGLQRYTETGVGTVVGKPMDIQGLKSNADEFPMELSINSMLLDGQQMFIGMVRDTSQQHELETQLRHAQKMEAIGELVGGVAHNFNNLLAGIVGKAYLAKMKAKDHPAILPYLESIEAISVQAGDMVKQLLTFAHKDYFSKKQTTSLSILVKEAFKTAQLGIAEDVALQLNVIDANINVYCDANQLQQVLMNMMNNARDALEGCSDKRISVCLETVQNNRTFAQQHPELEGDTYACLSITDNGQGMDAAIQEKIFDPFYSTKEVGKGTGLGLSSAFGCIESHLGVIEVASEPGHGTTFKVYLPVLQSSIAAHDMQHIKAVKSSRNHESVLLVDDEPIVLHAMQGVLKELGYRVHIASNGVKGLACFKKFRDDIDLIVTDVTMPKMMGIEMFRHIRRINANIPTIFITGYDKNNVRLQSDEQHNTMLLSKPVQVSELSQHIQQMLNPRTDIDIGCRV